MMKKLETVARVTHTHTQVFLLNNKLASNSKVFSIPVNIRNLNIIAVEL